MKDLLSDSNPMVVANAVAALSEINEASVSGHPLVGKFVIFPQNSFQVETMIRFTIDMT